VPLLLLLLAADIAVAVARSGDGDDNGGEQAAAPTTVTTAAVSSATTTTTATTAPPPSGPTPNATGVTAGGSGSASSRPLANTGGPAWTAPLGGALLAGGLATRQRARRLR
jgi:hypothetical protein